MPPRLSKRQQREQEELLSLTSTPPPPAEIAGEHEDSDISEAEIPDQRPKATGFAAVRAIEPALMILLMCIRLASPNRSGRRRRRSRRARYSAESKEEGSIDRNSECAMPAR